MRCSHCGFVSNKDFYVCPYCDSIEPMEGVSKAELQGMLRDAIVDVRKESIEQAKESLKKEMVFQDNRSAGQKILDALILILQIGFCLFLAIFTIGIFVNFEGVGFVSLIQLGLMITAMILMIFCIMGSMSSSSSSSSRALFLLASSSLAFFRSSLLFWEVLRYSLS